MGVGGHLQAWPDLIVSVDLSFVSTFIFDVLHRSDICWDRFSVSSPGSPGLLPTIKYLETPIMNQGSYREV